ncbi:cytoglobin-1 [Paramisgurnus dabryanus]|uniref:cytoglobin-1 n=1 Tax=Paramisgurnus dabryanus TaxID=90735 RepID=UPI0031F38DEB
MDAKVEHTQSSGAITDEDVSTIQDTWKPVYEKKEDAGVAVLIRFFMNNPSAKQYFTHFGDMQGPDEMRENAQLKKHALRIMNALNMLVTNLRDVDKVNNIFTQMGKTHALKHKVDPVYFEKIAAVILEVLVEAFPQFFSAAAVQGVWSKLMGILCTELNKVYTEVGWESIKNSA